MGRGDPSASHVRAPGNDADYLPPQPDRYRWDLPSHRCSTRLRRRSAGRSPTPRRLPAAARPVPSRRPRCPVALPAELDPDGAVTVEVFVPADEVVAGNRAAVALDRWRTAIRDWRSANEVPSPSHR
jgi:hypothetical protein